MKTIEPKIGFDLDGTLTRNWIEKLSPENIRQIRKHGNDEWIVSLISLFIPMIPLELRPLVPIHLISNRPLVYQLETALWATENAIICLSINLREDADCFFRSEEDSNELIAKHKAETINDLGLDEFYEDEKETRDILKTICPDTKILSPEDAIINGKAILNNLQKRKDKHIR